MKGPQGAHWGLFDESGILKLGMEAVFNGEIMSNNWSCEKVIDGPGEPIVIFTFVPDYNSFDDLEGNVRHVRLLEQ